MGSRKISNGTQAQYTAYNSGWVPSSAVLFLFARGDVSPTDPSGAKCCTSENICAVNNGCNWNCAIRKNIGLQQDQESATSSAKNAVAPLVFPPGLVIHLDVDCPNPILLNR